jgi:hypothetical protein
MTLLNLKNRSFLATLNMGTENLIDTAIKLQTARASREGEVKLLESVVAIADSRHCPIHRPTSHLLRVISLLWRTLLYGDGVPDLAWADPSATLPLRVHTFATILHLVGATSLFLAKNGFTQVDGTGKFSFVILGRVLALVFDEYKLFGPLALEQFDLQYWCSEEANKLSFGKKTTKKSPPKVRHVRQTFELGQGLWVRPAQLATFNSTAGDLATPASAETRSDILNVSWSKSIESSSEQGNIQKEVVQHEFKVDSKFDFQNLMRLSTASDEIDDIKVKPSRDRDGKDYGADRSTKGLMQAYGGIPNVAGRRYMTMPAPLSTILESGDEPLNHDFKASVRVDTKEINANEVITFTTTNISKQMRRPRVVKSTDQSLDSTKKKQAQLEFPKKPSSTTEGIATSDDTLTSMGDAFLDRLTALEGLNTSTRFVFVFRSDLEGTTEYFDL